MLTPPTTHLPSHRWLLRAVAAAPLLVTALSCGDSSTSSATAPATLPAVPPAPPATSAITIDSFVARLRAAAAASSLLVVNTWATTCAPCVQELPGVVAAVDRHAAKGARLLLVSFDVGVDAEGVGRFLAQRSIACESLLRQGPDLPFVDALGSEWSGMLPATFVYDRSSALRFFHEGTIDEQTLATKIQELHGG